MRSVEEIVSFLKGAWALLHALLVHYPLVVSIRDAIIAGSTGRMAMILLIYGGPLLRLPRIDVVGLLGSVAAPNKEAAITLGGAIHFALGIFFAIIYAALWSLGVGSATWWWGILFGGVHGIGVILLLLVAMRRYPHLSPHFSTPAVLVAILLNHMVYGLVVAVVYVS